MNTWTSQEDIEHRVIPIKLTDHEVLHLLSSQSSIVYWACDLSIPNNPNSWVWSSFLFFALLASSTLIFASCSIIVYLLLYLLLPGFTVTVTWPAVIFVSLASREKNKREAAEGMTVWTWVWTWELAITGSSTALNVNRITSQSKTSTKFAWLLWQASYSHT